MVIRNQQVFYPESHGRFINPILRRKRSEITYLKDGSKIIPTHNFISF